MTSLQFPLFLLVFFFWALPPAVTLALTLALALALTLALPLALQLPLLPFNIPFYIPFYLRSMLYSIFHAASHSTLQHATTTPFTVHLFPCYLVKNCPSKQFQMAIYNMHFELRDDLIHLAAACRILAQRLKAVRVLEFETQRTS